VDSKKLLIAGGVGVGAYLIYKSLQLRQTVKNIQVYIQGIRFDVFKTAKNLKIIPKMVIVNPVGSIINISNIYGTLTDDSGNTFGYFQTGPIVIQGGSVAVEIPIIVNGLNAFSAIVDAITQSKYPKLTISYTISLAGGIIPIKNKITFDTGVIQKVINYF
jgi:hypothetical protein